VKPVSIGKGSWIGANLIILPSVEIGISYIVAVGAIVRKSSCENQLIKGQGASASNLNSKT
jgi:acetyltransferase-like isoleucine patch superfamily enzyme